MQEICLRKNYFFKFFAHCKISLFFYKIIQEKHPFFPKHQTFDLNDFRIIRNQFF